MSTITVPTLNEAKEGVLRVLTSQPDTARIMNPAAITEEFVFGPDATVQDEDLPPVEFYEAFEAAIASLADEGLMETGEVFGMETCYLSKAGNEVKIENWLAELNS